MAKSKSRQDQEVPMVTHTHRIPEILSRFFRKIGRGNESEGVRIAGEEMMRGWVERRHGPDRRKKK